MKKLKLKEKLNDIEVIMEDRIPILREQMTTTELNRLMDINCTEIQALTIFWKVKEVLSKILKPGLMTTLSIYEVSKIEQNNWNSCYQIYCEFSTI